MLTSVTVLLSCRIFVHRHLSPLYPLMKYLNPPSAPYSQEPPTLLIIFVLPARQLHHLEGRRQLSDNFLYHHRIQEIREKDEKIFSHIISCLLHLSHVDLWLCCLFRLHPEGRRSEVPPNSWGVFLASALSILLYKLDLKSPTQQKTSSSIILNLSLFSKNSKNFFSLKNLGSWLYYQRFSKYSWPYSETRWTWTHQLPEQWMTQWVESWEQQPKWGKEEHLLFSWSFISSQQNPWHQKSLGNGFTSLGSALFI